MEPIVAGMKEAASYAAERSIKLAIEPLNRFETDLVNAVDQGIKMVDDVAAENVGLLLDTFHMNIEEKDIPAAIGRRWPHRRISRLLKRSRNAGGRPSAVEGDRRSPEGRTL
jgi:sugar phosphate isomerase/epimerase